MLKYTGVELGLITDLDMHQMVEKSMRGDISNISHRYATGITLVWMRIMRTKNLGRSHSLSSWAMSQMLPFRGFKFVSNEIDILNVADQLGYILEVDLEYPK